MGERGKWDGVLAIAAFNWPFYATAAGIIVSGCLAVLAGGFFAVAGAIAVAGCSYFLVGSLGVSHWVYDRSDLYRWAWLDRALKASRINRIVLCHSGFDEVSEMLKRRYPQAEWMVLDHFDPATMTEASIRRARNNYPPTAGTVSARFDRWPVADASQDTVLGLLAIHELRSDRERAAWFAEARRCLADGGRVVVLEHVRDLANFVAFGPGFLHFHSIRSWSRSWKCGGLVLDASFRITPFVRVFVLKQS